jgi:hypothetical protein
VISSFALPKRLQVSVNGHQRHSEHFAELGLCERQRTRVGLDEASESRSMELLAKEMCNPRGAVPAAVVGNTFAEDRRIYNVSRQTANPIVGRSPKVFISCS